ncbi:hypothetical protein JTE90_026696 [Oedothorax gibbosus]|uniref:Peptidase M13 N-terminal domain-containing protein n=1 Tax=Oedothorax gibbosus TaxID=931172 RepID=A0AAV6V2Q7_9ARAC|nr:hypothetical protein JTE90_026696 [Oedothorax gibbosus]
MTYVEVCKMYRLLLEIIVKLDSVMSLSVLLCLTRCFMEFFRSLTMFFKYLKDVHKINLVACALLYALESCILYVAIVLFADKLQDDCNGLRKSLLRHTEKKEQNVEKAVEKCSQLFEDKKDIKLTAWRILRLQKRLLFTTVTSLVTMASSPLLLAATTALLFFTTFHVKQETKDGERSKPVEQTVCTTESCLKSAGTILDRLDQTVHPCKDFYQFACGNYIRRTVLPENIDVISVTQNMEDEVLMIIFRALESPTLYRTGGSLIKAKMLYETCMNSDTLEDDSVQVLRLFLSERGVGHWPVLDADWSSGDMNLEWRLAMLFVHHAPVFFHMYADAPSFSPEYILNIYPASSPLGAKEVSGPDRERIFEAYHKLLIETLRLLGVAEVRVQADSFDIIGFELQFSMITNISQNCLAHPKRESNGTFADDDKLYNMTVDDLEYHIPQIKWSRLMSYVFRNLGLALDTSNLYVMVHCKEYFMHLGTLLSNTPPRTLANYMSWKFVLGYMSFMSMPFRQIFQDYTLLTPELKHSKLKTYTSRWKGCVSLVGSWFGNAIAAYYARQGYPREVDEKV